MLLHAVFCCLVLLSCSSTMSYQLHQNVCEFNVFNVSVNMWISNEALVLKILTWTWGHTQMKPKCTSCAVDAQGGRIDGWMDGARMWHACMTSFLHVLCAILVEKKSRTISVVLTDLEASLTLIVDAIRFSEQAALFDQVLEAVYSHSCYMKQWRVSHFWRKERDPPHLVVWWWPECAS